ncbi:hypothetical protein SEA_OLINDD_102 [Microbacterium phage OlinDD]|nr:hypothetical protein SEA_OLINDD_102 [Microbacterium phage OlinDD]AWY05925.1 hypothetical protein SEA_PIONEER3_102 [Microbacterium phage Pioneer3]
MSARIERNRRYLNREIQNARDTVDAARARLRDAEIALDEFELRQRPTYPTTEIRLALERAVEAVKAREVPKSHMGRQLGAGVTVHGEWAHIYVAHLAPYGRAANGYLWNFTEPEVQRMREHIEAFGVKLDTDWAYAQGHTFVIALAK